MRRTPTLAFLLVTIFIDALGLGLIVPIGPALLTAIVGNPGRAAQWAGLINASYGLAQFLVLPLLGRIADRYGRRPVVVLALTLLGLDYLVHAVANSAWLFLVAHALAGAFAGTTAAVSAAVADITEPGRRPQAYGRINAAFGLGFIAGPAIGGLLGAVSLRLPFYAAAGLAFANALYGQLIVPESHAGDGRTSLRWRVANPVSTIAVLLRRPGLRHLTVSRLLSDVARVANQVVWVFVMTARFGWSASQTGMTLAASSIVGAAVSARLADPLVTALGERRAAIVCTGAGAVSLAGFATVPVGWLVVVPMGIGAIAALGSAATQSWLSRLAGPSEQGTVQAALAAIGSLAEMAVPVLATVVFAWSLTVGQPGLVLLAAAAIAALAGLVLAGSSPAGTEPADGCNRP
jgi:MFS transporter, DHA1 family, tetracycline resistance protein